MISQVNRNGLTGQQSRIIVNRNNNFSGEIFESEHNVSRTPTKIN